VEERNIRDVRFFQGAIRLFSAVGPVGFVLMLNASHDIADLYRYKGTCSEQR